MSGTHLPELLLPGIVVYSPIYGVSFASLAAARLRSDCMVLILCSVDALRLLSL